MEGGTGLLITAREVSADDARAATASEVRRLESELERALDLLDHGDAFYVLDSEFRYVLVNEAQEASSGKKRDQTLGRVIWEVWPADPRLKCWDVPRDGAAPPALRLPRARDAGFDADVAKPASVSDLLRALVKDL